MPTEILVVGAIAIATVAAVIGARFFGGKKNSQN